MNAQDHNEQLRLLAESDLEAFIKLVHPKRMLGAIHSKIIQWWTRQDAKSHQLVLLPRDHQKSALIAYRVAWEITRNPTLRVLYISSTSNLAVKQLKFIKDILTSDRYRKLWPDMVNPQEALREKWTETEISVDDPRRKAEAVRDPTIFTAGLTTTITGLHCDIAVLDDIIVKENAYTEENRERVKEQYSLLSSIEGTEGREWVVGTRYHPKDLYNDLMSMEIEIYNDEGDVVDTEPLFEKMEEQVESNGDGTGEFLWPKQIRSDGKAFGFDQKILAKKRGQYLDKVQFRAQYYNNPNDEDGSGINRDYFQYYDRGYLKRMEGRWYFKDTRLNVFASVDFAFSLKKKADYTTIMVVGIDPNGNYYILDIDRFKTDLISDYYKHILALHQKWDFRKIRAEVSVAQQVIVNDLKNNYIRRDGLALSVEEFKPSRHGGTKEERIQAILQPRYQNRQIWHYQGGNCQSLEEELVLSNPPHDDLKDALASCIDACVAPTLNKYLKSPTSSTRYSTHQKFGGIN